MVVSQLGSCPIWEYVIALPGCNHLDNMTHMLKTAAADVRSQLMREREARAQGSKGRENAHFAAGTPAHSVPLSAAAAGSQDGAVRPAGTTAASITRVFASAAGGGQQLPY